MKPTQEQFETYQQIFDYLNQALFDNKLPDCMLSFSRKGKKALGFFKPERWKNRTGVVTHEICLNPERLEAQEPRETMTELVHLMVHHWQYMYGRPSQEGYHNQAWADKMVSLGLIPTDTGAPNGKRTGRGIRQNIEDGGRFEQAMLDMPKNYLLPFLSIGSQGGTNLRLDKVKYSCTGCGVNVWGKAGLDVVCGCGHVLENEVSESNPTLLENLYQLLAERYEDK